MDPGDERFLSMDEAAQILRVSDQSIRRYIRAGRLKAYKPGQKVLIAQSDLRQFLETTRVQQAKT